MSDALRGGLASIVAFGVAWLAWTFSPALLEWLGIADLELLGRGGAVVLALSAMERVHALLPAPEFRTRG